jgi:hypothetical protein
MISPITWFWNIRHRKLIEETKALIRLHFFLKEVGLKEDLSLTQLREILSLLRTNKRV